MFESPLRHHFYLRISECAPVPESEDTRHWCRFAAERGVVAAARNPYGEPHNSGHCYPPAIGGGRAGIIETAFWEEFEAGLSGALVVSSAAVEVRPVGQPVEGAAPHREVWAIRL